MPDEIQGIKLFHRVGRDLLTLDFKPEVRFVFEVREFNCTLASPNAFSESHVSRNGFVVGVDCNDGPAAIVFSAQNNEPDSVYGGQSSPSCTPTQPNQDCTCAWQFVFENENVDIQSSCS